MLVTCLLLAALAPSQEPEETLVHSVCDLSQEFTFYMDGRFHRQYLDGVGRDARNWGSLAKLDLVNVNLLVLGPGDRRLPYSEEALDHVDAYVRAGGTLLLMADGAEEAPPVAALVERFGARLTTRAAQRPLRGARGLGVTPGISLTGPDAVSIELRRGNVLEAPSPWSTLVRDAKGRPVLSVRGVEGGFVLLGSRGLFGERPDASDPINAAWLRPLLAKWAAQKSIDPALPHRSTWAEHEEELGPLTLEYHDGTVRFARAIADEYFAVRPHPVALTGVEPSPGMLKRLLILPTGGGGFSSGARIAIGAWWGNYPERRYPMVELIGHEAGHSWVLPHPEPLWNEPIATYLGIQVGKRMGLDGAQATLDRQLARGRAHDPDFDSLDPLAEDAPRDLVWGKSYFVFEELERLHGPGALAKYFRTKREVLAAHRSAYTFDDCVAVWSLAVDQDLFPWFAGLGFGVDRSRTTLSAP